MSETNPGIALDNSGSSTPLPPIDNIHSTEPNLPLSASHAPLPPYQNGDLLDTEMAEATPAAVTPQHNQPPHIPIAAAPPRTATPTRQVNGTTEAVPTMPAKAASHGAPARRYLNEKVTGVLLEGMKRLAAEQPEDPLRVLGEFLLQRSRELEGTS